MLAAAVLGGLTTTTIWACLIASIAAIIAKDDTRFRSQLERSPLSCSRWTRTRNLSAHSAQYRIADPALRRWVVHRDGVLARRSFERAASQSR
jgi:hypothetical protein